MYLFLPLGMHPPANQFLKPEQLGEPETVFPLDACVCLDCGLIQIPNHIPPDFFRHYVYVPSASETMHRHFAGLAEVLAGQLPTEDALVVDIGCNDGLFLGACRALGLRALGIEPATNLAEMARGRGIEVVNDYFTPETARAVCKAHGLAGIIVTTNTLNHIDDLQSFMEGITILLGERGRFVVEVPQALDLVEKNEFDTIYHEHVSEFSVKSLVDLFAAFDMEIADIERLAIHGGSMRVWGQRKGEGGRRAAAVQEWLAREWAAALFSASTYEAFGERVRRHMKRLVELLGDLKATGKRLAGYGAPAKGNTLLNYCKIGPETLEFLADKNHLKHGLLSPGMHIPVVPAERVLETQPDYLLLLAWNFGDEIMREQEEYQRRGGKFIVPIPELTIVG